MHEINNNKKIRKLLKASNKKKYNTVTVERVVMVKCKIIDRGVQQTIDKVYSNQ